MKAILTILTCCWITSATFAQKVLIVQNLRWPEIQKIYVGEYLTYELHDDRGNRYTRQIMDIYPERNSIQLGELEVPITELKRIQIRNHVGWGFCKKARRWLASYAHSEVIIPPVGTPNALPQPTIVTINVLSIAGKVITRTRDVKLGGNFRLVVSG